MRPPEILRRPLRSRALLASRRRLWMRAAQWRHCTSSIQCGGYIRDKRPPSGLRAPRRSPTASKGYACSISAAAAASVRTVGARKGAQMVGADPSQENIAVASAHAQESGVAVDYRATTAEDLAAARERFDVVLAMEVVEHVADVGAFACDLRVDGEARRADDRGDVEPHAEELRAGDRRCRIRAALAAARHPSMGQVRDPERARARVRARRLAGHG